MSLKLGQKIFLVASVPLAFLLAALVLLAFLQRGAADAARWADHSRQVLAQADDLSKSMTQAEDDQRGYLLTGHPSFLASYQSAVTAVGDELGELQQLVTDNPQQSGAARLLDVAAQRRLRALDASLAAFKPGSAAGSRIKGQLQAGSAAMTDFQRQLRAFSDEELRLQDARNADLTASFDRIGKFVGISAVLAIVLTILLIGFFNRGVIRRISDLGDKATRFAAGAPLGEPDRSGSDDEIARADRAFHMMVESVAQRQDVLDRYRLLAENVRDIILFLRRSDARIIEANDAAVAAYGYDRAELLTMSAADLRVPDERARLEEHLERSDQGPVFYESRHQRKDGSSFPVEVTGQGAFIGGERVLMSIVRDVSDRKRVEDERDRFFDASIDMMCVANLAGYFVRVNAAWERTLGYTRKELTAIPFTELIHPDDLEATATAMRVLAEGAPVTGFENRYRRKDGEYLWFAWSAYPSADEGLIYAVARDVTERKLQLEELARSRDRANEASRVKSEFLANMSHEIRTPMNGVIGTAGLLSSMALTPEQREYVSIIKESGDALMTIIDQILDLSKLEAGKVSLEVVEFSPVTAVESITMLFSSAARQKGLTIQSFVEPAVPRRLRGDAGHLRQILSNLTSNAIKFTERGGIVLRAAVEAGSEASVVVRFTVSDTGIGLDAATLARLFEPFTQADSSTTRRYGGTGLGLSISKRLVELLGGSIGVDPNEDGGTTFWFTAQFGRASSYDADATVPMFAGVRALVVDPDPVSRDVLHQYMHNWGMRNGVMASTADEALELLRNAADTGDPYHLALIDAAIAEAGAGRLAREIARDTRLRVTKLILLRPILAPDADESASTSDFAYFLTKPVRQSYLFDCIAAALNKSADGQAAAASDGVVLAAPATASAGDRPRAGMPGRRILVAEDNEINRRLLAAQLKRLGAEADFVANGREAVDAVATGAYQLVFMDCQMPEMDGFAATRAIRKSELRNGKHVPIVAITANAMEGDRESCMARGMDDYLSKPVDLDGLRATLDRWLDLGESAEAVAAPAVDVSAAPIDLERLREFFGPDDDALRSLLRATIEESESVFGRLQKAVEAKDPNSARQAAHELKGFAANIGAGQVATLASRIEGSSGAQRWNGAQDESTDLRVAIDRMVAFAVRELHVDGPGRERP